MTVVASQRMMNRCSLMTTMGNVDISELAGIVLLGDNGGLGDCVLLGDNGGLGDSVLLGDNGGIGERRCLRSAY